MPLQAQQIVNLACQEAKCPGFLTQAGQLLNATLQDLYQNYDLEPCRKLLRFNFNSVLGQGSGPYFLPADYLRTEVIDGKDNFFYIINGVPYPLIQVTIAEYHWLVQTPGFQSYPYNYATDLSSAGTVIQPATVGDPFSPGFSPGFGPHTVTPPPFTTGGNLFVWPPASGSYDAFLYYYSAMPDIPTPETSPVVPWFLNTQILIRSLAGRLMGLTGDNRQADYLGDGDNAPLGAGTLLKQYLRNAKDREGAVQTVGLDRRRWGRPFDRLKNTKTIGWMIAFAFLLLSALDVRAQTGSAKTPTQMAAEINSTLADNTAGLITPAILRQNLLDISASFGYLLSINNWTAANLTTGTVGIGPRFNNSGATPDSPLEVSTNTAPTPGTFPGAPIIHVVGPNSTIGSPSIGRVIVDSFNGPAAFNGRRADGASTAPTPIATGEALYNLNTFAWDSSDYFLGGQYIWFSFNSWTPTDHSTFWTISTTPRTTTTPVPHLKVFDHGGVAIGTGLVDPGANNLSVATMPTSAGAGGLFVCIDNTGVMYKKATCP